MIDAKRMQVLLVEDNATDAMIVEDELEHAAGALFSVVHLDHLSEALARLKVEHFDVVLLDLSLPDSHGLETFERLRRADSETPIVVLSGRADEDLAIKAVQAGAQDYLVKGRLGEDVLSRSLRYAIERHHAERTLSESEERYRLLIEQSPDGYLVHCDNKIVFANTACLKIFGADRLERLLGRSILESVSPQFHDIVRRRIQNSETHGSNASLEILGIRQDGTTVTVEATSNPFTHEGRPAVQVVLHDITERKRSEQRFRWLVDSNAQGVMFWNANGETTGGNDAFLRMVGYSREDLEAGRISWSAMTPPEYNERDHRAMEEIVAKGFCAPFEKEWIRKDGTRVPILIGAAVFEDNRAEGVSFVLDLTEQKRVEQNSLRTQRMESIGTLAGGIAHDLNNTLGPIIMSLDLLQLKFPDRDSQELLSIISASAHRGADMVKQVLSFARGVEGRRMEVQIRHLVQDIEKIINDTFLKHIQVRTITSPVLGTVLGDPTQLHQVLLNLCVNARDAMPNGGSLVISAENLTLDAYHAGLIGNNEARPGPYVLLQVRDSGTGIPADILEKIFDPFFTTKEIGSGTGLGLSTSLGIIKSHGGFVVVESDLGKGTKFQVYLPALAEPSSTAADALEAERPRGNGELILVIDDEGAVRHITRELLEACGYRVVLAANGAEAVAIFARQGEDVAAAVTDMMMPVMDGPSTIRALRTLNPKLRIIAVSGLSCHSHDATLLGVQHFLPKPHSGGTLLKALKQVLSTAE